MHGNNIAQSTAGSVGRWHRGLHRAASFGVTIRGRILIAFLVMSTITAALGGYATLGIKDAAILVDKTYDESLMSINYARAAATDFAAMRAAFARLWIANDPAMREKLDHEINTLTKTLYDDLAVAVQRSQSNRAKQAAANVRREVALGQACASVCSIRPSSIPIGKCSTNT